MRASTYLHSQEGKLLGTVETLNVILEHRKILSQCIQEMDSNGLNYITEYTLYRQVKTYTELLKSDTQKRIRIAFSTSNLLQSHIVMDVDSGQTENRLYFQSSVLDVVRLCDVSLFKKLTDIQLNTHLQTLNQVQQKLSSGELHFSQDDDDFMEFIDNLFLRIGRLMSEIRQNVVKMQSLSKELETLTASSISSNVDSAQYIVAKQQWLDEIVKLYERHILPVLLFLNPESTYQELSGLHGTLTKISDTLFAHNQDAIANNVQSYALSFLNFYQPIEATANVVNRFIHKERDSIKRFNAIERCYQSILIPELQNTRSDNLNKKLMGNAGIIKADFSPNIKAFIRPNGYGFNHSPAYYKNMFNELEARTQDIFKLGDLNSVFATATANTEAATRMLRHHALIKILTQVTLRDTDDLLNMLHLRLKDQFEAYQLYDLISCLSFFPANQPEFNFKITNLFANAEHQQQLYKYRKVRCTSKELNNE